MSASKTMQKKRIAQVKRNTTETQINVKVNLDGQGKSQISTGVGFFDHMLGLLAKHSLCDLEIKAKGDLEVDEHHTVEDVGICLGQAIKKALGDRKGIHRYASIQLAMDETLCGAAVDISGRPMLIFNAKAPQPRERDFDLGLTKEFFKAFSMHAGATLHINVLYGFDNLHHVNESIFKAVAKVLMHAVERNPREKGIPSTKGSLE